jgi:hypothetical protein
MPKRHPQIARKGSFLIDRQVRSVRMQTDKFHMFLRQKNGKTTNLRLHDEQMVDDLRKITWASISV